MTGPSTISYFVTCHVGLEKAKPEDDVLIASKKSRSYQDVLNWRIIARVEDATRDGLHYSV